MIEHEHEQDDVVDGIEAEWRRKDGSRLHVAIHGRRVLDDAGNTTLYEAFVRDITRTKELEDRLRQGERMEALGRLAGGVAHDFNNYLTVIFGSADELRQIVGDEGRALVAMMLTASERALSLTNQLLAFGRRQTRAPEDVDLNDVVAHAAQLLERVVGDHVHVVIELDDRPAHVHADRNQLEQALMNLAANGRDGMPNVYAA